MLFVLATSSFLLLVAMPFVTSSDALVPSSFLLLVVKVPSRHVVALRRNLLLEIYGKYRVGHEAKLKEAEHRDPYCTYADDVDEKQKAQKESHVLRCIGGASHVETLPVRPYDCHIIALHRTVCRQRLCLITFVNRLHEG